MKKIILGIFLLLPFIIKAQNTGVKFVNANSWKDILTKAKAENKYIFLDIYATWCGPCKKMDADVYTKTEIAEYANMNYIPVKVQADKTNNDAEQIKKWYSDADFLVKKYKIEVLPAFLFFSPDGELVDNSHGYQDAHKFLSLLKLANDPNKNYSGKLLEYKKGIIRGEALLALALEAQEHHDDSLALKLASQYKNDWLSKQNPEKVLSSTILTFLQGFYSLMFVDDKFIKYLYQNPTKSDAALGAKGYSVVLTDYVITKDIIDPIIKLDDKYVAKRPDWDMIEKKIAARYDKNTAMRLTLNSKLAWYKDKNDWPNIVKYNIEKYETEGIDTVGFGKMAINNMVFYVIVAHSNDPVAMNKGLKYMELILKSNPKRDSWLDTYASLLYKIGQKEKAIEQELNAISIAESRGDFKNAKVYRETLEKIKENQPLW